MKKLILTTFLLLSFFFSFSQEEKMTNERLFQIIQTVSEESTGETGNWQFIIDSTLFICLTDVNHNRMRIISPVEHVKNLSEEQLLKSLEANFHTVLDTKYAISDGVLWSVFIHPLGELTDEQVLSAISQVYSGVKTFGTHYSSGFLSFPKPEKPAISNKDKKL